MSPQRQGCASRMCSTPLIGAARRTSGCVRRAGVIAHSSGARSPGVRDSLRALFREHQALSIGALAARARPAGAVEQIRRSGGARRWTRELGVPGPQPATWTDELIEAELRVLCAHKSIWPTKAEFLDAGLGGLLTAVRRGHGSA
jgi:hypothetical protein